jgi:ATP-dependent helicase/nuclease subunit A
MVLIDQAAREQIRHDFDHNMVVEAAAGTGKTSELVRRIIGLLGAGRASVGQIIAVTFTEKAAGELKLRLRSELDKARRQSVESAPRQNLENALTHLEEARLSTIHGLCVDLLRERPVEARIDPEFEVMTEVQSRSLYREAFRLWFERRLENLPEGIRRFLRRRFRSSAVEELIKAGLVLADWRDFPAPWRRDLFAKETEIDRLVELLCAFADVTRDPEKASNSLFADTAAVRAVVDELKLVEDNSRGRDYDGLEALFVSLANDWEYQRFRKPRTGYARYKVNVSREDVLQAHAELLSGIEIFVQNANADLAPLLQAELAETVSEYQTMKERAGKLDFLDLLVRMRDLLVSCPPVRRDFQNRFTHIFIDEFQDTDPLQAEMLLLLAAESPEICDWRKVSPVPGKLFIVGDPKQAIYRFRRADVGTYEEVKKLLLNRGASFVELTTSFRSVPAIQRVVNESFSSEMDGNSENLQAAYVPLSPFRTHDAAQPSVVALPVPEPYGVRRFSVTAVEKSLPDAIAAYISWLVQESGWTVSDKDNPETRVPLSFGHICLLFRRLYSWDDEIARPYIRAMEARNIPHLLVGGRSFHNREEVQTVRTALAAIEWPDDELSVFATLHGSLFAIRDDVLLEYRHRHGKIHPFHAPSDSVPEDLRPVIDALGILRELHRNRNHRPVSETIEILLGKTRSHVAFALRPSGEQVLGNVLHLSELARKYEASGGLSFRGFVEALQEGADVAETGEAAIFEEGGEGVRITTVYKAKGLEFPVVIMADITGKISRRHPSRHIDPTRRLCAIPLADCEPRELQENATRELARDRAEGVRVAYVAATRARDLLLVPTIGDHPFGKWDMIENWWVRPLYKGLYPRREFYRHPEKAVGCPKFGQDSVLERPDNAFADEDNVSPGLHRFGSEATYEVVWWDPRALKLKIRQAFGIRLEELLAPHTEVVKGDLTKYEEWRTKASATLNIGAKPSFVVRAASEAARIRPEEALTDVSVMELPREAGRPVGARFGTLVHGTLALVDLDASPESTKKTVQLQARILGAPQEEIEAASIVVQAVLAHPLLKRARNASISGQCHREVPITLSLDSGMLVEGVADLAFLEEDGWTILDFKTDRELEIALQHYKTQIGLYAKAISRATGRPALAMLMSI